MKTILLLLAAAFLLCGCATTKPATPTPTSHVRILPDGSVGSDLRLCNEPVPVVKP